MYGYIQICKPELKFREFDEYRTYYCGLCRSLRECFGAFGQFFLSYDFTFLAILLDSLYEPCSALSSSVCIAHPLKKQSFIRSEVTQYAAEMCLIMSAYKFDDDWKDEGSHFKRLLGKIISKKDKALKDKYIRKINVIERELEKLYTLEKDSCLDPILPALCFGNALAEIFAFKEDVWEEKLRTIGFHMGCFIYIADAFDDIKRDIKKGCYNPFISRDIHNTAFIDEIEELLRIMIAPAAEAFEYLPVVKNSGILKNILYAGVWTSFRKRKSEYLDRTDTGGNI